MGCMRRAGEPRQRCAESSKMICPIGVWQCQSIETRAQRRTGLGGGSNWFQSVSDTGGVSEIPDRRASSQLQERSRWDL